MVKIKVTTVSYPDIHTAAQAKEAGAKYAGHESVACGECAYCGGTLVKPVSETYMMPDGTKMKFYIDSWYCECSSCGAV